MKLIGYSFIFIIIAFFNIHCKEKNNDISFSEATSIGNHRVSGDLAELIEPGFAGSDKDGSIDSLITALTLYEKGKYEESRNLLYPLTQNYPENDRFRYYFAMSQLNLEKYAIALNELKLIQLTKDEQIMYDAEYYYGLVLNKVGGEKEVIKKIFKRIANDKSSPYQEAAQSQLLLIN